MEKPFIIVIRADTGPSDIERRLEEWGCRIQVCGEPKPLEKILARQAPDLLILDRTLLVSGFLKQLSAKARKAIPDCCRFIVVDQESTEEMLKNGGFSGLLDSAQLHRYVDSCREGGERKHLRLSVNLPGVYFVDGTSHFADILTLGTGGAFIKIPPHSLKENQEIGIAIPLLGMKKEIEATGRVVYEEEPSPKNNYVGGFGLEFLDLEPSSLSALLEYILRSIFEKSAKGPVPEVLECRPTPKANKSSIATDRGYRISFDR